MLLFGSNYLLHLVFIIERPWLKLTNCITSLEGIGMHDNDHEKIKKASRSILQKEQPTYNQKKETQVLEDYEFHREDTSYIREILRPG